MTTSTGPISETPVAPAFRHQHRLPEERFWRRYSPHHEFTLSLSSSAFLHAVGLLILFFGGLLLVALGLHRDDAPLSVDVVGLPGIENQAGAGGGPAEGAPGPGKEAVPDRDQVPHEPANLPNAEPLQVPQQPVVPLAPIDPDKVNRAVEGAANDLPRRLDDLGKKAGAALRTGPGGPGNDRVSRRGPPNSIKVKRRARWVVLFNTLNGHDYLRQLRDLNAFLAIQQPDGQFMVYRDLKQQPVPGKIEDVSGFTQIRWVDDTPESVRSLSLAMGLADVPAAIEAYFPLALESELLAKEMAHLGGKNEDDVEETVFTVVRPPGSTNYQVKVASQRLRKGR
ncbi:MAG TPA: hypothetical protein VK395_34090 [Gemmataceae bacterium]|nr:hypothetical protein [Gemmataceae bacterium]